MGIGTRMKLLRKQAGMTQPELAEKLCVHETTIRRWEQEKDRGPDTGMINRLAEIFKVSTSYLLDGTEEKGISSQSATGTSNSGRDIELNDRAGRLVFKDGTRVVDLPDTPDNKKLYWQIVERMLNAPAMA